nr:immunoglobulin heavy chain junction region [Mus musculus]
VYCCARLPIYDGRAM